MLTENANWILIKPDKTAFWSKNHPSSEKKTVLRNFFFEYSDISDLFENYVYREQPQAFPAFSAFFPAFPDLSLFLKINENSVFFGNFYDVF